MPREQRRRLRASCFLLLTFFLPSVTLSSHRSQISCLCPDDAPQRPPQTPRCPEPPLGIIFRLSVVTTFLSTDLDSSPPEHRRMLVSSACLWPFIFASLFPAWSEGRAALPSGGPQAVGRGRKKAGILQRAAGARASCLPNAESCLGPPQWWGAGPCAEMTENVITL